MLKRLCVFLQFVRPGIRKAGIGAELEATSKGQASDGRKASGEQ
jgi:hypothetical protein